MSELKTRAERTRLHGTLAEIVTEIIYAEPGDDDGPMFNDVGLVFRPRDLITMLRACSDDMTRRRLRQAIERSLCGEN